MKLSIKKSGGLPYAKKEAYEYDGKQYEADLITGDTVRILDGGETEMGNFGEQTVFKIRTKNGDKKLSFNQDTINVLIQEFGDDTEMWINKDVKVILHKTLIAGKKAIVPYLVTEGWSLDEYGELSKAQDVQQTQNVNSNEVTLDQIPF